MAIAILSHQELREYHFGSGHPFHGDRFDIFLQFLKKRLPEDDNYHLLKADWATEEDLLLICQKEYIDFTKSYYYAANLGLSYAGQFSRFQSGDNLPFGRPGRVEEAARLIVGQAKAACHLVQGGEFKKVVSLGGGLHHARPAYGEGFCLYNDVAFSGLYLMQEYGLERILILDTDAHAGNGTSEYFYEEPRVLFIDLHQDPMTLYPGTGFVDQIGSGRGRGFTINIPLPPYAGYDSYKLVFESIVEPVTREFSPQIIIRNGGSDPHFADQLTNLGLPVKGFRMIGEKVREMAKVCDGKAMDLIASGYNQEVLPYGWLALIAGLGGIDLEVEEPEPAPQRFNTDASSLAGTERVVEAVKNQLKDYWSCLS
ncbi:MAG: histone deacetylase family protein [Dehalococcoidales bacterium]|nr:histone deacetylase family protein [Dehalococcoidales bacterium]